MKNQFNREGIRLVKNLGLNNLGKFLKGFGAGLTSTEAICMAFLSKGKITREDKVFSIVGPVVWIIGTAVEEVSEHRMMITSNKGGQLSKSFETELEYLENE